MWRQNLEQRIQELKEQEERQRERYAAWTQTLREEFKVTIKKNA
jgi:chaperonin cofactor prefoldin